MPIALAQIVRQGSITIMARNFGVTKKRMGLIAIVSSASISSVTFIVPISAEGRAGTADHDDGRDKRPKFPRHRNRDRRGDIVYGSKPPEFIRALERENQSYK